MERALAKLPHAVAPDGDVMSAVQHHLINRLASLRYNPPPTKPARGQRKKDKLPAGETYICPVENKNTATGWGDDCLFISFMDETGDLHKWPKRRDVLNTLKADVLFACQPPEICASTSSSRNTILTFSKAESKKAKELFLSKG
jgi:hypothetical protein